MAIIAEELLSLHKIFIDNMLHLLQSKLVMSNMLGEKICAIVSDIKVYDAITCALNSRCGVLGSSYKILKFYRELHSIVLNLFRVVWALMAMENLLQSLHSCT